MLSESICVSIASHEATDKQITASTLPVVKDAAIFTLNLRTPFRPTTVFKKSSTRANSLAVSQSHVFAAQADKAVIHVYNASKGNQEATIPFGEKATVVATAGSVGEYLIIGTEEGNVLIWETFSGRLVKAEQSHIQSVTAIAVDASSKYFLTGSADATVLVWSLVSLLSFGDMSDKALNDIAERSPVQTLAKHSAGVTAIALGHSQPSSNYAISTAEDKTALLWHYTEGLLLRTYLLEDIPRAIAMDPADRAGYIGYDDGTIQVLEFYGQGSMAKSTRSVLSHSKPGQIAPIQPPKSSRWRAPPSLSAEADTDPISCLCVSYDSSKLICGQRSGKVSRWDVGRRQYLDQLCILPGPVTNIVPLVLGGISNAVASSIKIRGITKPRSELSNLEDMTAMVEFPNDMARPSLQSDTTAQSSSTIALRDSLSNTCFSADVAQSSIDVLHRSRLAKNKKLGPGSDFADEGDFISFDGDVEAPRLMTKDEQIKVLQEKIQSLERVQKESSKIISEMTRERSILLMQKKPGPG